MLYGWGLLSECFSYKKYIYNIIWMRQKKKNVCLMHDEQHTHGSLYSMLKGFLCFNFTFFIFSSPSYTINSTTIGTENTTREFPLIKFSFHNIVLF